VPAHRRAWDERPAPEAQEVVGAHQPRHPLGVDDQALAAQRVGDSAVAVISVGERHPVDEIA